MLDGNFCFQSSTTNLNHIIVWYEIVTIQREHHQQTMGHDHT